MDVLDDLLLDVGGRHLRFECERKEVLKLEVLGRRHLVFIEFDPFLRAEGGLLSGILGSIEPIGRFRLPAHRYFRRLKLCFPRLVPNRRNSLSDNPSHKCLPVRIDRLLLLLDLIKLLLQSAHTQLEQLILAFGLNDLLSHELLIRAQAVPLEPTVFQLCRQLSLNLHLSDPVVQLVP